MSTYPTGGPGSPPSPEAVALGAIIGVPRVASCLHRIADMIGA